MLLMLRLLLVLLLMLLKGRHSVVRATGRRERTTSLATRFRFRCTVVDGPSSPSSSSTSSLLRLHLLHHLSPLHGC
uniref:Putative secreted protein n=1 Tax=Anopheles marajoara TaxID=58244 RepID=A0A2M4CCM4_9DIPT